MLPQAQASCLQPASRLPRLDVYRANAIMCNESELLQTAVVVCEEAWSTVYPAPISHWRLVPSYSLLCKLLHLHSRLHRFLLYSWSQVNDARLGEGAPSNRRWTGRRGWSWGGGGDLRGTYALRRLQNSVCVCVCERETERERERERESTSVCTCVCVCVCVRVCVCPGLTRPVADRWTNVWPMSQKLNQ